MPQRIYLDHAATTPMRPEAVAAVEEGMRRWANPSSPHAEGRAARAALEDARQRIKAALGWDGKVILTSGASEAISLALTRGKADRSLLSAVEHESVFRVAPDATLIPMAASAVVDRDALAGALTKVGRPIVAVQHMNSETGTIQPVDEIAVQVRKAGGILLSDCAQSAGKYHLPDADLIVVSAHKLGGPPGIGALLVRDLGSLEPTGGQELGYRGGTENLPAALGFAAALDAGGVISNGVVNWLHGLHPSIRALEYPLQQAGGDLLPRVSGGALQGLSICAIAMPGVKAATQLIRFDQAGIAVSAGSACSSGTLKQSRALRAFGVPEELAECTIRVSFGWNTTAQEIDAFGQAWLSIAEDARKRAA